MLIGNTLGLLAGYRGGRVDFVIMRCCRSDVRAAGAARRDRRRRRPRRRLLRWPSLLLIVLTIPYDARLIRGRGARAAAASLRRGGRDARPVPRRIMVRHIWPNVLPARRREHVPELRVQPRHALRRSRSSVSAPVREPPTGAACSPRTAPALPEPASRLWRRRFALVLTATTHEPDRATGSTSGSRIGDGPDDRRRRSSLTVLRIRPRTPARSRIGGSRARSCPASTSRSRAARRSASWASPAAASR